MDQSSSSPCRCSQLNRSMKQELANISVSWPFSPQTGSKLYGHAKRQRSLSSSGCEAASSVGAAFVSILRTRMAAIE